MSWVLVLWVGLAGAGEPERSVCVRGEPVGPALGHVELRADGAALWQGVEVAALGPPLLAWARRRPARGVVIRVDPRATSDHLRALLEVFRNVGLPEVWLESPELVGCASRLAVPRLAEGDGEELSRAPFTVHLTDTAAWVGRRVDAGVWLPHRDGAPDLDRIAMFAADDRRIHAPARWAVVRPEGGVPHAAAAAVLEALAISGYSLRMLDDGTRAGAPPSRPQFTPVDAPLELPHRAWWHSDGFVAFRSLRRYDAVAFEEIRRLDAHCDDITCDLVLHTRARRVRAGQVPLATAAAGWIYAVPVVRHPGRLGGEVPTLGTFDLLGFQPRLDPSRDDVEPFLWDDGKAGKVLVAAQSGSCDPWGSLSLYGGETEMQVYVRPDGTVLDARVLSSDFSAPGYRACMADAYRRTAYTPRPGGGIVVDRQSMHYEVWLDDR